MYLREEILFFLRLDLRSLLSFEPILYLLEELRHLAHQTGVALHLAFVPVGQEEVAQQRGVRQRLDDAVHEARVAEVYQTSQA